MVEGLRADQVRLERIHYVGPPPVHEFLREVPHEREVPTHALLGEHVGDGHDRVGALRIRVFLRVEEEQRLRRRCSCGRRQKRRK